MEGLLLSFVLKLYYSTFIIDYWFSPFLFLFSFFVISGGWSQCVEDNQQPCQSKTKKKIRIECTCHVQDFNSQPQYWQACNTVFRLLRSLSHRKPIQKFEEIKHDLAIVYLTMYGLFFWTNTCLNDSNWYPLFSHRIFFSWKDFKRANSTMREYSFSCCLSIANIFTSFSPLIARMTCVFAVSTKSLKTAMQLKYNIIK